MLLLLLLKKICNLDKDLLITVFQVLKIVCISEEITIYAHILKYLFSQIGA